MNLSNIHEVKEGFKVLQTTQRSQTAVMILDVGDQSSEDMNVHEQSDQVLLLLEGELQADIGRKEQRMQKGDVCIVPAGTPHRFGNCGKSRAVTFTVYSPPEYPPDEDEKD